MTLKYLNLTGLNALVSAIKTWVLSRVPTKTSELTNDANFITSNDLPTNHVTIDTNQTITGTKTFTSTIDGTASKAIADEDGTSIKTGYVNVAGNQTVTGNKSWTGSNTFTAPSIKGYASIINDSMTLGTVPASTLYNGYWFKGSTSDLIGSTDVEWTSNGTASIVTRLARNTSGASRELAYGFGFPQTGNGTFRVYGDCLPGSTNTYSLGSSSYQWSSVYAQTYYYNGTEFQNKFVTTDTEQTITSIKTISRYNARINLNNTSITRGVIPSSNTTSQYYFGDSNGAEVGRLMYRALSDGTRQLWIAINDNYANGTLDPTGTNKWNNLFINIEPAGRRVISFDTDDVTPNTNNAINLGTSTSQWKSVYSQTYYYNGTQWGLDKANVWTQPQTFQADTIYRSTIRRGTAPSSNVYMEFADYKDSANNRFSLIGTSYELNKSSNCCIYAYKTTSSTGNAIGKLGIGCDASGNVYTIAPTPASSDDSTQIATTAYVKSQGYLALNGLNPGALSLPDLSNAVSIDTTGWVTDGSAWNIITSSSLIDGYLYINYSQCSADDYIAVRLRTSSHQNLTFCISANTTSAGNHYIYASVPVSKLFYVFLEIKTSGTLQKACVFPCQGNV